MTMRIYTSQDTSAPSLQGVIGGALTGGAYATGSLLELLRQVLVAGYGAQTAAGWTMPFTGTSHATFKQGAGCGFYLDVLDDGTLTAGAREAAFSGFVTASAVGTGTAQFPTVAQQATNLKFRKSDTADSAVRQWMCFADSKTFYLFSWTGNATAYFAGMAFGNFTSLVVGDAYNCLAIGRVTSAAVDSLSNEVLDIGNYGIFDTLNTGHYFAAPYTQIAASTQFGVYYGGMVHTATASRGNGNGVTTPTYPNPSDNGLYISKPLIIDTQTLPLSSIRGYLRGFWGVTQLATQIPGGVPFSGVGTLSGRTFKKLGLPGGNSSAYLMETSDTWDS